MRVMVPLALLSMLVTAVPVLAQEQRGAIEGTVQDAQRLRRRWRYLDWTSLFVPAVISTTSDDSLPRAIASVCPPRDQANR